LFISNTWSMREYCVTKSLYWLRQLHPSIVQRKSLSIKRIENKKGEKTYSTDITKNNKTYKKKIDQHCPLRDFHRTLLTNRPEKTQSNPIHWVKSRGKQENEKITNIYIYTRIYIYIQPQNTSFTNFNILYIFIQVLITKYFSYSNSYLIHCY
jgi:hypothetical protein